jgi:polysaccharide chain length determinant protein (PEP-CTERM system associated)
MQRNKFTVQDALQLITRRKVWVIFCFLIGVTCTIFYSYSLPLLYRSSTLILVEPQKIPTAYVSPTVTSSVQERLSTISQQILSRTNLERIITQFGLYANDKVDTVRLFSRINQQLKHWIGIEVDIFNQVLNTGKAENIVPLEAIVDRMRKDVEVKVVGGGNAFTISYSGKDPLTVMKVTNTLASLFIEENLRIREQQAEGTSEFLENQLAEAKRQLEKQEQGLKEYKEVHTGALPGQMDVNLRTLDRLQLELASIDEGLRLNEDRRMTLTRYKEELQNELKNIGDVLKSIDTQVTMPLTDGSSNRAASKLSRLKEELARLQAEFNDTYPDVISLKRQIREAEEQLGGGDTGKPPETVLPLPSAQNDNSSMQQANAYSAELNTLNAEIQSLRRRRERTIELIKQFETRVEDTFANEQNLLNLARDYETSQRNYQGLLDKLLNAKISENLEKRQKGEQFRILDPANFPEKPYKPDRRKIILLGSLLSAGIGVGIVLLREYLGPAYRKPEDFHGIVGLPVLATIPRTAQERNRPLISMQEVESLSVEQYRILYTRITQLTQGTMQTVFAISSSVMDEGKTINTLNLALIMARDFGKKTLVIEGDFKKPSISTYLKLNPQNDLVDILLNRADIQSGTIAFAHENLSILPVVKSVKNSSGILNSQAMSDLLTQLRERYDFILIDAPPILSLPDMNILERLVDGIILVVRAEKTPRDAVVTAIDSLVTGKLVGIILNDVKQPISWYHRYSYDKA